MFLLVLYLTFASYGRVDLTDAIQQGACLEDSDPSTLDIPLNYTCPRYSRFEEELKIGRARISGGAETSLHEFPFAVGLANIKKESGGYIPFCGGSIISNKNILTAAHCVYWNHHLQKDTAVLLGTHDRTQKDGCGQVKIVPYSNVIIHQSYDNLLMRNDIAVLILKTPLSFSESVQSVALPAQDLIYNFTYQLVKIIGWGSEKLKGPMSAVPRVIETPVVSIDSCVKSWCGYVAGPPDKPKQLCTLSPDRTACQGDSGGPVIWRNPTTQQYTLVGVVSYGANCSESRPSVHTSVSAYANWISEIVQKK